MDAMPPTPDSKRSVLTKSQHSLLAESQKSSPSTDADDEWDQHRRGRLRKENHGPHPRRNSLQQPKNGMLPPVPHPRMTVPVPDSQRRSVSAQPPPGYKSNGSAALPNRVVSTPLDHPAASSREGSPSPRRGRIRKSWMPGSRSRSASKETRTAPGKSYSWVLSDEAKLEYNTSLLKNGERVPELWNETGSLYVYLHPKGRGLGPSFKVPPYVVGASGVFNELIQAEMQSPGHSRSRARSFDGRGSLSVEDASRLYNQPNSSPEPEAADALRLYLPPPRPDSMSAAPQGSDPDVDRLIAVRNLFAFLTGQPLVGSKSRPTIFETLIAVADLLQRFHFVGPDGAGFGEHVDMSFGLYMEQFQLADCRQSKEKTVEALLLAERMRNEDLYKEAYAHAVGQYSSIMEMRLQLYTKVSPDTRQRLERAHLDLVNRQQTVDDHLQQFEFPALFAGIASSTSNAELKQVRFKIWRNSFNKMRQLVLGFYKHEYGNWPPKASSKKNPFAESGLNRIVLKVLYKDLCDLYDLLVDRTKLTTRVMDAVPSITAENDPITAALHTLLSEFDRSKPPVLPPVPFDLPQSPSMSTIIPNYASLPPKEQARFDKKLKDHELELILSKSYNSDAAARGKGAAFIEDFRRMEYREAKGKNAQDLLDQRIGYWVFLYVVIQSLPMLVVDAPGLQHTRGCEYFLCEPPMGTPPWIDDSQVRKKWYGVAGGGGIVELATDTVMFSVEGIYHRSHCWLAASQWDSAAGQSAAPQAAEPLISPLQPPPAIFQANDGILGPPAGGPSPSASPPLGPAQPALRPPRNFSPSGGRHSSRSSIALGLEPVPLEPPPRFDSHQRSSSIGPPRQINNLGNRSGSVGDLPAMVRHSGKQESKPKPAATSGATFDDILGGAPKTTTKKKSKFF